MGFGSLHIICECISLVQSIRILMNRIFSCRVRPIQGTGHFLVDGFILLSLFFTSCLPHGVAFDFQGAQNIFICYVQIYLGVGIFCCFRSQFVGEFVTWDTDIEWNLHEFDGFVNCENYVLDVSGEVALGIVFVIEVTVLMESLRMKTFSWFVECELDMASNIAKMSAMYMLEKEVSIQRVLFSMYVVTMANRFH